MRAAKQTAVNRRLRRQIRRLRSAMNRRIRREQKKCAGKCDRKMPIYVGHEGGRVLSTTTRHVYVLGDKERNKKRWTAVETNDKLMWHPPKLTKVHKFHKRAGRNINKNHVRTIYHPPSTIHHPSYTPYHHSISHG